MDEWKAQAEALFFMEHKRISEIAVAVGKSRKAVSGHINGCEEYETETAFRRRVSAIKRREYQRQWDKENRPERYTAVSGESLRQEHDIAALILSRDRFNSGE